MLPEFIQSDPHWRLTREEHLVAIERDIVRENPRRRCRLSFCNNRLPTLASYFLLETSFPVSDDPARFVTLTASIEQERVASVQMRALATRDGSLLINNDATDVRQLLTVFASVFEIALGVRTRLGVTAHFLVAPDPRLVSNMELAADHIARWFPEQSDR